MVASVLRGNPSPEDVEFRIGVDLSTMRSIFGLVTPGLRAVVVHPGRSEILGCFFFADELTQENLDDVSIAEARVAGDFPPPMKVMFSAIWWPMPTMVVEMSGEQTIYMRCED